MTFSPIILIIFSFYECAGNEETAIEACIGIRREDKNEWERRAPLTPSQVAALNTDHGIRTLIQPSSIRIFPDDTYREAGAIVQEDLSACSAVFGVKEMPVDFFLPGKTYAFFSHTIKGQAYNMPMLKRMMALGCNLIDYERVSEDKRRLLFFGRYAGLAGMVDTLWALGRRLLAEGIENPFSGLKKTYEYGSLEDIQRAVSDTGESILSGGIDESLRPLLCGFAGYGHVSQGAQEILDRMPVVEIDPAALNDGRSLPGDPAHTLYKVVFREEHLVEPVGPDLPFLLREYYDHPEAYRSKFESYLPSLTVFINAIYWTPDYPRLVTKDALGRLFRKDTNPRLRVIGDITCDIGGAVECTVKATQPDHPIFVYDPLTGGITDGHEGRGVVVMALDNLPCELPEASSEEFGNTLSRFVPEIATADFGTEYPRLRLSPPIKNSLILHRGKFTPSFEYMDSFI